MFKKVLLVLLLAICFPFAGCKDENNPVVVDLTPKISAINPATVALGQSDVDFTITGTNLTGTTIVGLGNGIQVNTVSAANATTVAVNATVRRNTNVGARDVTVVTPNGTTTAKGLLNVQGAAPIADFSYSPKDISQTTEVSFDGSPSNDPDGGSIEDYSWDFGDGKKASGMQVKHTFDKGSYNVSLAVTDNDHYSDSKVRALEVLERTEIQCTTPSKPHGFLQGTVIGVEGKYAILQMDKSRTCDNTFYYCGDMRLDDPEQFRGIIKEMFFLGDGKFKVLNDCPAHWPPKIGELDVLIWKSCSANFCP